MSIALPHVAERLFGRPHAIDPVALQAIVEGPAGRRILAGEPITAGKKALKARDFRRERLAALADAETIASRDGLVQYALTPDGVAVIPVAGVLTQKFDWLAAVCGWTTYDAVQATLSAVIADHRVSAILLDVDSPGGEVSGMLDAADAIVAARDKKPVWAVANPLAASAAYAIGASARRLVIPRLARVGSIGAVMVHVDQSASDKSQGLKYTAIYSGSHKIDGWNHAPLSEEARAAAQRDIDHVRNAFAALVGRQGRISEKNALATEAAMFTDTAAVEAGLADEVMTFDDALAALSADVKPKPRGLPMSQQDLNSTTSLTQPTAAAPPAPQAPQAGQTAAPIGAPEANAPKAMTKPSAGEKCELCGQTMHASEEDDTSVKQASAPGAAPAAAAPAPGAYTVEDATETSALCQIARAPGLAAAFIAARTPLATVRAQLTRRAADAADGEDVDPTPRPAGKQEQAVAAAWDDVVAKINAENRK